MSDRRPVRIAVAGQIPPPMSGQFVMVEEILNELSGDSRTEVIHIPFRFTLAPDDQGAKRAGKLLEVFAIWKRAIAAAFGGRFDIALYPIGGTRVSTIARDLVTLPVFLLTSRRVVLHFHAGGHASTTWTGGLNLQSTIGKLYRRAGIAIVMSPFNRRDPEAVGIATVQVIPHRLPDSYDEGLVSRGGQRINVLYIGHVRPEKGFPEVLEAFAAIAADRPEMRLSIAGEILPPLTREHLGSLINRLGVEDRVHFLGPVRGQAKWRAFGEADLALFPTRAGSETFGLVLIEAMMWGLPLVATDWRGNREILGEEGAILFPVNKAFSNELETALRVMIRNRASWGRWGAINRSRYLDRFSRDAYGPSLADFLAELATRDPMDDPTPIP